MANKKQMYQFISSISILVLILSGCSSLTPQNQDQISTAVVQTIQAQSSLTKVANITVPTSAPTLAPANTLEAVPTNTAASVSSNPGCTVSASLVAETPPDEAVLKPSDSFWKTWTLKNTGTCIWNQSYKFIYWSGDLMDGLMSYPLPDEFAPGEQKDISIYLRAPASAGSYAGYWKIQTPWGVSFGVGQYDEPIYAKIIVSDAKHPAYAVTSVDFNVVRNPDTGCPPNVFYTLNATISTNGPLDVKYHFTGSGSVYTTPKVISFTAAETKTVSFEIDIPNKSSKPTDYWIQFFIDEPPGQDFKKVYMNYNC